MYVITLSVHWSVGNQGISSGEKNEEHALCQRNIFYVRILEFPSVFKRIEGQEVCERAFPNVLLFHYVT